MLCYGSTKALELSSRKSLFYPIYLLSGGKSEAHSVISKDIQDSQSCCTGIFFQLFLLDYLLGVGCLQVHTHTLKITYK